MLASGLLPGVFVEEVKHGGRREEEWLGVVERECVVLDDASRPPRVASNEEEKKRMKSPSHLCRRGCRDRLRACNSFPGALFIDWQTKNDLKKIQ